MVRVERGDNLIQIDMLKKQEIRITNKSFNLENNVIILAIELLNYDMAGKTITAAFEPVKIETGALEVVNNTIQIPIYSSMVQVGLNYIQLNFRWENKLEQSSKMIWIIDKSLETEGVAEEDIDIVSYLVGIATQAKTDADDLVDVVQGKLDNGDFIGEQGPQGEKGDKGDPGEIENLTSNHVTTALGYNPVSPTQLNDKVKTDVPLNAKFTDTIVDISGKLSKSNDTLETYTEKIQATTGIINLSLANVFTDTPSASRTYSITNAKSGVAHSFTLIITMGSTVRTLTFPSSVKWQGGEIPDMTTASKTYVLTFLTVNGGTAWLGMSGGEF